jgi:hypothetical protein
MSVEKQSGDSPTSTISQQNVEQQQVPVKEEAVPTVTMECPDASMATFRRDVSRRKVFGEELKAKAATETTRCWFDGLSSEERLWALSFSDGPFLATLLDLASWSSATGGTFPASSVGEYGTGVYACRTFLAPAAQHVERPRFHVVTKYRVQQALFNPLLSTRHI